LKASIYRRPIDRQSCAAARLDEQRQDGLAIAAALVAALFASLPADRRYSGDWWQVKEEEAQALRERQERKAAEQEAKALENYHGPRWWENQRV
jgi:hypothetical protein